MINISEVFGSMVFNDEEMKKRLPPNVYENLKKSIDENLRSLSEGIANLGNEDTE